jgi:lipopolysaccharide exporter
VSTTRAAARGAVWTIGTSLFSRLISLIGTLVLIRFVAPESYGEAWAAVILVGTVNQIGTLGVGIYVIVTRDASREEMFHATFIHVGLGVLAFVLSLVLARPLGPHFGAPNMDRFVPLLALGALADRITFMPERVLIRGLKFRRISLIRSLAELTYTGVSVTSAWLGLGGMAIVAGNATRAGVRMLAMLASVDRRDWLQWGPLRLPILKKIGGFGAVTALGHLGSYAQTRWDNLMVSSTFGPAVMGAYNLAYNLAEIPVTHVAEQITDVMEASYAHMDSAERRRTLLRAFGVIGLVTFPLAVGLGSVAPTMAGLFLDKKWAGTGVLLTALAVLFVTRPPYAAINSFITVDRGPGPLVKVEWITVAVLMAGLATLGRISPVWACAAVGLAFLCRLALGMYTIRVASGIGILAQVRPLLPPLFACVPMALAVWATRTLLRHLQIGSQLFLLGAEIACGGAAYVAAALVVAPLPTNDVLKMVRRRRERAGAPALE